MWIIRKPVEGHKDQLGWLSSMDYLDGLQLDALPFRHQMQSFGYYMICNWPIHEKWVHKVPIKLNKRHLRGL